PLERSHLGNGYVGNAEWLGVPLHRILERAGLKPSAHEVVLEGADRGRPAFAQEEVPFAKSLPLEKALHPDTLLVYAMNGVPLPREHGGPVRAVVPGWYGTYHVKWLGRVSVSDRPRRARGRALVLEHRAAGRALAPLDRGLDSRQLHAAVGSGQLDPHGLDLVD